MVRSGGGVVRRVSSWLLSLSLSRNGESRKGPREQIHPGVGIMEN